MKTTVKLFVILLALVMQAGTVCADGEGTPLTLTISSGPKAGNINGPRRAPARPRPLYIDIFLNEVERCLSLYDPEGSTITYNIYNEDEDTVACGTISFANQPEATISLDSLEDGIYYLEVVLNGTTYSGEFGLEE